MEKNERRTSGAAQDAGSREPQRDARPAPGKVTRTSRLAPSGGPAVQRQAAMPAPDAGRPQARSAWDRTTDPWMDAAHRGLTALAEQPQAAGPIQAPDEAPGTLAGQGSAPVQAKGGVVQMMGKDPRRGQSERKPRRNTSNPYSTENLHRPKPGGRPGTRLHDKAKSGGRNDRPAPPRVHDGHSLWDGSRDRMRWQAGVYDGALANAANRVRVAGPGTGLTEYQCCVCNNYFLRKSDADALGEVHIEVDHHTDWRRYVMSQVSAQVICHQGHLFSVYYLDEVLDAYNDQANLRAMCQTHNGSKNGPKDIDGTMTEYEGPCPGCPGCGGKAKGEDDDDDASGTGASGGGMTGGILVS